MGGLHKEPTDRGKKTGSTFRWKPDLEVFTDIDIPVDYYTDVMKRQAVVNAGGDLPASGRRPPPGDFPPRISGMTTGSWTM